MPSPDFPKPKFDMSAINTAVSKSKKGTPDGLDQATVRKKMNDRQNQTKIRVPGGKALDLKADERKYTAEAKKVQLKASQTAIKHDDPKSLKPGGTLLVGKTRIDTTVKGAQGGTAEQIEGHLLFLSKAFGKDGPDWMR